MPRRPADDPGDWNWAYAATDAWLAEAAEAGLEAEEIEFDEHKWEVDPGSDAGLVTIDGTAWVIFSDGATDMVRARIAESKDAE